MKDVYNMENITARLQLRTDECLTKWSPITIIVIIVLFFSLIFHFLFPLASINMNKHVILNTCVLTYVFISSLWVHGQNVLFIPAY